ncbi:MAG: response regulator [Bacteroidales bacterium]|nr:response regulator [Bacteroidales bacterium]
MLTVKNIPSTRTIRVLLAEDEHLYQHVIEQYIHEFNIQLTIVNDGKACLDKVDRQQYDVILMDIIMPEFNGLEVARAIRNKGIKTPIIAVTSNIWKEDEIKSIKSGMNDFLPKPFNAQKLARKITYWSKAGSQPAH